VRLVGRHDERTRIDAALRAAAGGSGVILEVIGEPGIGKSTVLGTLCGGAREADALVLEGRAAEFERDLPFGVLVDALDPYLASLARRRIEQLGPDRARELAAIFPALEPFSSGDGAALLDSERFRLHRAVRSLLERLAASQPLVLVLDDLHWADAASIELITSLIRRPPDAAVLVALAYRPRQAPESLASAAEQGAVERLALGPLSREDSEQLLGEGIDRDGRARLFSESGGNPFYLEQLARSHTRAHDGAVEVEALEPEVPAAVAAALAGELRSLSDTARTLAQGAAVVGDPFEPELAAAAAALGQEGTLAALDELLEVDVVRATGEARRFRFRHPLVRRAIYQGAGPAWRLGAHARTATALTDRGAVPATLAHHLEQSAMPGDEAAITTLVAAAEATATKAPATAAHWFAAALRLLPEHGTESLRRLELLPPLAMALGAAGELEQSREALLETLALLPPDETELRIKLIAFCGALEHLLGRHEEARARLVAALEDVRDRESAEGVALRIELAVDGLYAADSERVIAYGTEALAGAKALGDDSLCAFAAAVLTFGAYSGGQLEAAQKHYAEAQRYAGALDDTMLAGRREALFYLGWAAYYLDRYEEAIGHLDRVIAVSRATGQGQLLVEMMIPKTLALVSLGRLAEAVEVSEAAVEAARLGGNPQTIAWTLLAHCWALAPAGDVDDAVRAGEEAVALARSVAGSTVVSSCGWSLAIALAEAERWDRCVDVMLEAVGGPELPIAFPGMRMDGFEALTRAEIGRGDLSAAEGYARRAREAAAPLALPGADALADRATAAARLAAGDRTQAAELALASAAAAESCSARVGAARARLLAGTALAGSDRERAAKELRAAEAELAACGAERLRESAVRELRRIGRRVHSSGRRGQADLRGVAALSGRELEVAELVKDRRTNREIATELFVSEKTVETHVSHVFVKLGVSSRVEAARVLEREAAERS
jgi:DNA-binding NarL/FixJ family response regulator